MHPTKRVSTPSGHLRGLICLCLFGMMHLATASADPASRGEPGPTSDTLGDDGGGNPTPLVPTLPDEPDGPEAPDAPEEPAPAPNDPDAPADDNPPPPPAANGAPEIGGTPLTEVHAEERYGFTPTARDPDGDSLRFSIAGKPAWATFDTRTGTLAGTPTIDDVGEFTGILISASDGQETASLGPFSILVRPVRTGSVSLSWQPPTQREDGSALTNLAGYRLFYGRQPGEYANQVRIENPGITRYVVDNLAAGSWYFVMTAFDADGLESDFSKEAVRSVAP